MEGSADSHRLTLRVMRLARPQLSRRQPVACESSDVLADSFGENSPSSSGFRLSENLELPGTLGDTFIGQTFSCFISVHNDSNDVVTEVVVQAELQTGTQRTRLKGAERTALNGGTQGHVASLSPGKSIDQIVAHEMREVGVHMLVCSVNYTLDTGDRKSFRKHFKIHVGKPVDIKPRMFYLKGAVFLEAEFINLMKLPMSLHSVVLEHGPLFDAFDCSTLPPTLLGAASQQDENGTCLSIFEAARSLQPQARRKYLFKLVPKPTVDPVTARTTTVLGRLDVVWRTQMGDLGRIQTAPLSRKLPDYPDAHFEAISCPSSVAVAHPFTVRVLIINFSKRMLELTLYLPAHHDEIVVQGDTTVPLGPLSNNQTTMVTLELVAIKTGLCQLTDIALLDRIGNTKIMTSLPKVLVTPLEGPADKPTPPSGQKAT